jgi:hypothetical protein
VLAASLSSVSCSGSTAINDLGGTSTGRASATTAPPDGAASQTDVDDAMRKRGYKPAFYRGERVYCRNELLTGSNLQSKLCLTARQIEEQERAGKDILNGTRPAGCEPKTGSTGCL